FAPDRTEELQQPLAVGPRQRRAKYSPDILLQMLDASSPGEYARDSRRFRREFVRRCHDRLHAVVNQPVERTTVRQAIPWQLAGILEAGDQNFKVGLSSDGAAHSAHHQDAPIRLLSQGKDILLWP